MARKRVRNKDLAEALNITENSVYRLRKVDAMPRLTPERLNGICAVLRCQPGDLLEWVPEGVERGVDSSEPRAVSPTPVWDVAAQRSLGSLTQFCDQIMALSWKGYKYYGPGAVVYTDKPTGPEIAYVERNVLSDPECLVAISHNRPEMAAVVLYYYDDNYDAGNYTIFTLTGTKSPPECYALLMDD